MSCCLSYITGKRSNVDTAQQLSQDDACPGQLSPVGSVTEYIYQQVDRTQVPREHSTFYATLDCVGAPRTTVHLEVADYMHGSVRCIQSQDACQRA